MRLACMLALVCTMLLKCCGCVHSLVSMALPSRHVGVVWSSLACSCVRAGAAARPPARQGILLCAAAGSISLRGGRLGGGGREPGQRRRRRAGRGVPGRRRARGQGAVAADDVGAPGAHPRRARRPVRDGELQLATAGARHHGAGAGACRRAACAFSRCCVRCSRARARALFA